MSNDIEKFLEHISTSEAQLKRFRKKVREMEMQDEITPQEIAEVGREIKGQLEEAKRGTGYECFINPIGSEDDDEDLTPEEIQESREAEESLREHAREIHEQLGIPLKKGKGSKPIKESKPIMEADLSMPARTKSVSFGKTTITEDGTHQVGDEKDGMMMVGPGIWLPKEIAENGNDEEILEYMRENRIGM